MEKIKRKSAWKLAPITGVAVAAVVVGALARPSNHAGAYDLMTVKEAHALKASMLKGQTDADAAKRPNSSREGSPSSAEEQFIQERTYPATDIPSDAYTSGYSQYSLLSQAGGGSFGWKELGPLNAPNGALWGPASPGTISGRATAIAVDPSTCSAGTCQTIYLGTANGGVWKSTTAGHNWVPLSEHQSTMAIGALTLDPNNPNTIYAGTGEPNNAVDNNRGEGLLQSTNGGHTWTTLGFNQFVNRSIANVVVDPNNSNTLYVATYVGRAGGSGTTYGSGASIPQAPPVGFYRSTDGGQTWTLSNPTGGLFLSSDGRTGVTSLVRGANGTLFIGTYGQGIFSSTDGGQTWTALPNSAETTFDRITLATAPSNANVIYAAYSHDIRGHGGMTFYSSTDAGHTWTAQPNTPSACTGQCWYDMPVNVDPVNAQTVYVGGMFNYDGGPFTSASNTVIMKTTNGGASWQDIGDPTTGVNIHPDDHAILAAANGGVFTANDGGLYHSANGGAVWESLNNGIGSLQFQGVSVNSNGDVFGGTQDNGTWELSHSSTNGIHIQGGDGGMTAADPNNSNIVFDEYYGSQLQRYDQSTGNQTWMAGWWFDYFNFGVGQFYEPVALGTKNADGTSASNNVFSGTNRLWRSEQGGGVDGNHDGDATNDPSDTTDFVPITPSVGNISYIAVSPTNPNDVAFSTTGGAIYYTTNALAPVQLANSCATHSGDLVAAYCSYYNLDKTSSGAQICSQPWNNPFDTSSFCEYVSGVNWTRVDKNGSTKVLPNRVVTGLTFAGSKLYATFSGFDQNTPGAAGHVFVTSNPAASTGTTWTNITGNLPNLPTNSIVVSPKGRLFVSADYGVFTSTNNGGTWQRADYTLSNAPVYQLALSPDGQTLYAATHGRGIWRSNPPQS